MVLGLGPIGWTGLVLVLLAAGVYCGWQAWATDDNNLLPLEYWLDNGTFGKRQFVGGEPAGSSPYVQADKQVPPFPSLQQEVLEPQRVLLVAQGRLWTVKDSHGFSIMCFYDVAVPRYESSSRLEIQFFGLQDGRQFEAGRIVCEKGSATPSLASIEPRLTGKREGPLYQHDQKAGTLRVKGSFSTMQAPTIVNKAFDHLGWHKDTNLYANAFKMQLTYWPDTYSLPPLSIAREVHS